MLIKGKLNAIESLELSRLVVIQNSKNLLENWLAEDKLEWSKELGDLVKTQVGYTLTIYSFYKPFLGQISRELLSLPLCYLKWREVILPVDYNTIIDLFLQVNMIREATAFLLDVLKPNLSEHAFLQTKVLEINLGTFPNVANAILANGMFSHYDRPRIAQLCEKVGLYVRALQVLVEFFGTLSKEWAMECLKDLLLVNLRGNLQIIVQVAKVKKICIFPK
ncbi:hypothetical protein OROHE_008160 [Orobanche hederae]